MFVANSPWRDAVTMIPKERDQAGNRWQASAQYWDKYRKVIETIFASLTNALIEEARIRTGQRVLDIGGGSGEPSLTISKIVGSTGSVMYTDPAAGMLDAARAEAERRDLTNISFTQCSGDDLPFEDQIFDVAVGRLSAMFFADPEKAAREALRVVREDGYASFVVWGPREKNPFLSTVVDVIDRRAEVPADDPSAPDPYRFASSGKLAGILEAAGAEAVIERPFTFQIQEKMSFEQFWQLRTEMSETLRRRLAGLAPVVLTSIKHEVAKAAQAYFTGGTMSFSAETLIVTATR